MGHAETVREITFEELQSIVAPIAERYGVIRVCLFGFRARGDSSKKSDFDFCVTVPAECDLMDLGGFLYDLKDALGADVDIVCEDDAQKKPALMEEILRDKRVVFEA